MSGVYNKTIDTPYSQNDCEHGLAWEQWQNVSGENLTTNHGIFRGDENNSTPTEIQLRETNHQGKLLEDDDGIPEWTNTFFGTTFRRYTEEWNQIKFKWQLKYGQTSSTYGPNDSNYGGFGTNDDRLVPYMEYKNQTLKSIESNTSSDTKWGKADIHNTKLQEFKRKRCICFAVTTFITCLVLAACITSALLIHVIGAPKNKNVYVQSKITATATNQKYSEGMGDASSQVFKDFEEQFCSAAQIKLDQTSNCKVESLRNGSIVVIFFIYIKTEKSEAEVKGLIVEKLFVKEEGKEQIQFGIFEIKTDSFSVTETQTISEVPKDSIHRPIDKDTDVTSSSSLSVSTTKEGITSMLQSTNPTTSLASLSGSSSKEIESSSHVSPEGTITEQIHTTTTEDSTPSLQLKDSDTDSSPSSTSSIVSTLIAHSGTVVSVIDPTSTTTVVFATEQESTTQISASQTQTFDTPFILSSTQDQTSNDYWSTSSKELSTGRSVGVDGSRVDVLSESNTPSSTSTLYGEYVSSSLLEMSTQASIILTSTEILIQESTQPLTTSVVDELNDASLSIYHTKSIVEEMYSNATTFYLTDSINSDLHSYTATASEHQSFILDVDSSHLMNSYSIDSSSAMVELISSDLPVNIESTDGTSDLMITAQSSITSKLTDLYYAPSSVSDSYLTLSLDESPVGPTPSSLDGYVTSTEQHMFVESTDGTSDLVITSQSSITSKLTDLHYAPSSVSDSYLTLSLDESPVGATPSSLDGYVTSTEQHMFVESTDGTSDLMITTQSSITSKLTDLHYAPSSVVSDSYLTLSLDESPVGATPSSLDGYVTSTEQYIYVESTDGTSDVMVTAQSSRKSDNGDLFITPSSYSSSDKSSLADMSFAATPSLVDGHITSFDLTTIDSTSMPYVLVTDSFGGDSVETLYSSLETPSLDGSLTETPSNYFTYEIDVPSIKPSSSIVDMSTSIPIPKPDVKVTGETVYQDQGNLTFTCTIDNYYNFTSIILEYDDIKIFNITENNNGIEVPKWTLVQTKLKDTLNLVATYNSPTCEDSNKIFRCNVNGDWGTVDNSTFSVVKVKPETPDIHLPIKFIENEDTLNDIYCSVDAGVPAATVSWSVEFVDGRQDDPYDFSAVTTTNSDKTCSNEIKSSIRRSFDMSWHNASLCCTATQDQIITSTCKKLYIIPANYCVGKEDKSYDHPYDDCYLFVQCSFNRTFINNCGTTHCFDENTQRCSGALATTTDPNFVDDPYSCKGKPNDAYIPVENSCKNYTRCVNGAHFPGICPLNTYFNGTLTYEYKCDFDINNEYCKRNGPQTQNIATTTDPNIVDDPYSCEGKPNYAYIPVEDSCRNYTRCVNGAQIPRICPESTYFIGAPIYEYTCDFGIDNAYCKRNGTQTTE